MRYNSTRNHQLTATPAEAVLHGIAPDGGLYLCDPAALALDPAKMLQKDFSGMAEAVLGRLLPDSPPELLRPMIKAAYKKFYYTDVTPLVPVGSYGYWSCSTVRPAPLKTWRSRCCRILLPVQRSC